ncbi:hypothetical protein PROFUN_00509 [Planoprotostelium fungivorum]|uniref:Uncharacterized protein n=1 Tax=Planoprotostelium fungivorum TaxID=1890364 RepID=A0A2P6N116_9EUKA|nr:hypothetical protein PROFUN_00509 [Planoprotostelium fungivorum]
MSGCKCVAICDLSATYTIEEGCASDEGKPITKEDLPRKTIGLAIFALSTYESRRRLKWSCDFYPAEFESPNEEDIPNASGLYHQHLYLFSRFSTFSYRSILSRGATTEA